MSLFQCDVCGCCENTALSGQGCYGYAEVFYDWTGFEDRKGKMLCSACAPTRYSQEDGGGPTEYGEWHGHFERVYLPMGEFFTNDRGNLEHRATKREDFRAFAIPAPGEDK